jgi:hypothetical protein
LRFRNGALQVNGICRARTTDLAIRGNAMSLWLSELVSPSSQAMVTSLQDVPTTVPRSVVAAPQQTRSPGFRLLDWSPVTVQTAPTSRYHMAQLFAWAREGSRFLHLARLFAPKVSRRMLLLRPLFGMFWSFGFVPSQHKKHTNGFALVLLSSNSSPGVRRIAGLYPSTTCRAADIFYGRAGPVALPWETRCHRTRSI